MWNANDANTIRDMIYKEVEFINHRVTWLVTLQGLLFAALGFAWKDGKELIPVLCVLGIGVSLTSLIPLWSAQHAIERLYREWNLKKDPAYNGPDVIGYYSRIPGIKLIMPWLLLPLMFSVSWIAVLALG
jgi:hypothetical protein